MNRRASSLAFHAIVKAASRVAPPEFVRATWWGVVPLASTASRITLVKDSASQRYCRIARIDQEAWK